MSDSPKAKTHPCTECSAPITGRGVTCSDRCRVRRSRRIKEAKGRNRGVKPLAVAPSQDQLESAAHEIAIKELTPVVREAITPDVVNAIGAMVNLTPLAISLLEQDLRNADGNIRQRAYTLLMKYTVGNPAVAPAPEFNPPDFNVNFVMPRPDRSLEAETEVIAEISDAEVVPWDAESRECMICHASKPIDEFVGESPRCVECHRAILAKRDALVSRD